MQSKKHRNARRWYEKLQKDLKEAKKQVQETCSHKYEDGTSAFSMPGGLSTHLNRCRLCDRPEFLVHESDR